LSLRNLLIAIAAALVFAGARSAPAGAAEGAPPIQYVVVPAIGQKLAIVRARPGPASSLGSVTRESFTLADATFEDALIQSSDKVLRANQGPGAPELLHARLSGALLTDADSFELVPRAVAQLIDALRPSIADPRRTRLVIIAPMKAPLRFTIVYGHGEANGTLGQGAEAGLGYYVDGRSRIEERSSGVKNYGFLGTFAHVQLLLVDFETRAVIAREEASRTTMSLASRRELTDPWEAPTTAEKVTLLRNVLAADIAEHLPVLLRADR
jgi:hypothetical protein